jgi:hypothetical protein
MRGASARRLCLFVSCFLPAAATAGPPGIAVFDVKDYGARGVKDEAC